jgi:hypothetical protein
MLNRQRDLLVRDHARGRMRHADGIDAGRPVSPVLSTTL